MEYLRFMVFVIIFSSCASAFAGVNEVRFLASPPKGCKKVGQVVGVLDRKLYEDWSFMSMQKADKAPQFMQMMKKQAMKMRANRIVLTNTRVDYIHKVATSGLVSYEFKTNTYTGMGYYCRP